MSRHPMPDPRRSLAPALGLLLALLAGSARAQDPDDDLEPEPADPQQQQMINQFTGWTDETFDQWVFGQRTPAASRARLLSLLTLQIEDLDRECGLSPAQKAKLELAGKGDIKHLYDRVAEKKRKFQLVKNDRNQIGTIFQEIQPLQSMFTSGPFDENSIYTKTIKNTLDTAQSEKYEKVQRDKRLFRYRAKVDLTVAFLDNAVGFRGEQRKKLSELILNETKPPKRYGQYDYYVVMWQLAHLPEERVKPIFDETQWKLLTRQLNQVKGMDGFLKQNGYLDALTDDAAGAKKDAAEPKKREREEERLVPKDEPKKVID